MFTLTTITGGQVSEAERDRGRGAVAAVLARYPDRTGAPRIRLTRRAGPGRLTTMQVNLRIHGAPARIQVAGRDVAQVIPAAAARLDRQVGRLSTGWQQWPWPDPEHPALGGPGAGEVTRRKAVRLRLATPCQAAATVSAMDYDAYLYTDTDTGEDAVVYRSGPTGVRLARQRTMRPPQRLTGTALTVNPYGVPVLDLADAVDRLGQGWLPFLFFTDQRSGRGNLLYRRYDGDLGLIFPTAPRAGAGVRTARRP